MFDDTELQKALLEQSHSVDGLKGVTGELIERFGSKILIISIDGIPVGQIRVATKDQEKMWKHVLEHANHMWINFDTYVGL